MVGGICERKKQTLDPNLEKPSSRNFDISVRGFISRSFVEEILKNYALGDFQVTWTDEAIESQLLKEPKESNLGVTQALFFPHKTAIYNSHTNTVLTIVTKSQKCPSVIHDQTCLKIVIEFFFSRDPTHKSRDTRLLSKLRQPIFITKFPWQNPTVVAL